MVADFRGETVVASLEVLTLSKITPLTTTIWRSTRSLQRDVHYHGEHDTIPPSLMDRMEIIRIAGYTEDEKVEIARKHLIPNVTTKHGLDAEEWAIDDEATGHHPPLHARGGRAQPRARALHLGPQGDEGADLVGKEVGEGLSQ